jgi:hypothetical protein
MKNKKCTKCLEEKELIDFGKKNKTFDGYNTKCKTCVKLVREEYQKNNRAKINKKQKEYTSTNIEKTRASVKKWQDSNKDTVKMKNKLYRVNNPEKIKKLKKDWNIENADKIKIQQKEYYKQNKDKVLKKNREWNKNNSHIVGWRSTLKSHLRRVGKKKEGSTIDLLGYSAIELKTHLESLFMEGMTWENHGVWEIDHIKPVTAFSIDELPSVVNALSNLQPLWKKDNRQKYNKYEK